jgi:glycosyltransferase involved in cell wall biosynthesis
MKIFFGYLARAWQHLTGVPDRPRYEAPAAPFEAISHVEVVVTEEEPQSETHTDAALLPEGFDPVLYLKLHPDVKRAGIDAILHYLQHGRIEGRAFVLPALDMSARMALKSGLKTVLVVSHEASLTGAPVLSLNLVQALVGRYNVVALLLGPGPLVDAFEGAGAAVAMLPQLRGNQALADMAVDQLCHEFSFDFALVNSIESRVVLPGLARNFVATVSLVHEFASYTRPRATFREALLWSGELVFSTSLTLNNARSEYPELEARHLHILPQGRCQLPMTQSVEGNAESAAKLRRAVRSEPLGKETVVVLGAGFVQLRKGLDLFIQCATRTLQIAVNKNIRFVWIGNGFDPENDMAYSVYLADQIRRAGISEHLVFLNETQNIEAAYAEADIFLLSSRLDPLPNVAIDAMSHGVPVLCFAETTGIAEFLHQAGLHTHCVAGYLDVADMTDKILALAGSESLRLEVGEACRKASAAFFDMNAYVAKLEALAADVRTKTEQEQRDVQLIAESGLFRADYAIRPSHHGATKDDAILRYVRSWASGSDRRKPCPGFHPGIYMEQKGIQKMGGDPFAHYLRAGQPGGVWNCPVIVPRDTTGFDLPQSTRIALHLHVYYDDLLPEILERLSANTLCPDLYISVTSEEARANVLLQTASYKGNVRDVRVVPNAGRDIGPLLTAFGPEMVNNYDYIGHIHTKKTADVQDEAMGAAWRSFLLDNLLGDRSTKMVDSILLEMSRDQRLGMVFPDDPHVVGMGANRKFAESLASRMPPLSLPEYFSFPVGSMFWMRSDALKPLLALNLDWSDYTAEPLPYDGSMLHAIERLFSLGLESCGLVYGVTNVKGVTR